jgi:LysM repeat protein
MDYFSLKRKNNPTMKRLFLFALTFIAIGFSHAQDAVDIQNYINNYKQVAIDEMKRTGVPASITLAQGILESAAGTSDLTKQSNNHFGIKCKSEWTGAVVYHDDDEKNECFRVYSCAADSYKDHSDFLKNRPNYAFLFQLDPTDFQGWAKGLKRAGYATEKDYPERLIDLIVRNHLQDYTLIALQKNEQQAPTVSYNETPAQNATTPAATTSEANDKNEPITINYDGNAKEDEIKSRVPATYPQGIFEINQSKVVYATAGTSLFALASNYNVEYAKLLEFNELTKEDILPKNYLIFLEKKSKKGANDFHVVIPKETIETIAQTEGVRLENLLAYNHLIKGNEPAAGQKIYLKTIAPAPPKLADADYASTRRNTRK